MRLLVSVRSAAEVRPALAGGADIIDAKEPSLGSLGPVSPATLGEIARATPGAVPLSVALGDLTVAEVAQAIAEVEAVVAGRDELYLKLGLADTSDAGAAERLASAAVEAARRTARPTRVILVAYADHDVAGSPSPDVVVRVAARTGADGILLDTYGKDGRDLFHYVGEGELRPWVYRAKAEGMIVGLAGSLGEAGLRRVATIPGDIAGVRGAACGGDRSGVVAEERVRGLKTALQEAAPPAAATPQAAPILSM